MPHDAQIIQLKAKSKLEVDLYLLAIAFTLFTFIIAINPALVRNNVFLSLQLTLAIPLLISSIFARTKQGYSEKPATWEFYGFITFILAYAFLINVVGILLSTLVSIQIGIIFWGVNVNSRVVVFFTGDHRGQGEDQFPAVERYGVYSHHSARGASADPGRLLKIY